MMLQVLLDCQPQILDAALSLAIERLPGITLVQVADGQEADVVITTHDAESGIPVYLLNHAMPDNTIIVLDRAENVLRLWELVDGKIDERILPGDLQVLFTILRSKLVNQGR